jgi:hypothetical protein
LENNRIMSHKNEAARRWNCDAHRTHKWVPRYATTPGYLGGYLSPNAYGSFRQSKFVRFLFWSLSLQCLSIVQAYRLGGVVDTDIRLDRSLNEPRDTLRKQMPQFGISSKAYFQIPSDSTSFSLAFEDGLRTLPFIPLKNPANHELPLEKVDVTFIYTSSAGLEGSIHAILSDPVYSSNKDQIPPNIENSSFWVEYHWMEEPHYDVQAGLIAMLFLGFAYAVYFVLESCDLIEDKKVVKYNGQLKRESRFTPKDE